MNSQYGGVVNPGESSKPFLYLTQGMGLDKLTFIINMCFIKDSFHIQFNKQIPITEHKL